MANIKSKIKRTKQSRKAAVRNKGTRSLLKTLISNFRESIEKKDKKKAADLLAQTSKALDKAVSKGVIHSNRAAAKKSNLSKQLKALK